MRLNYLWAVAFIVGAHLAPFAGTAGIAGTVGAVGVTVSASGFHSVADSAEAAKAIDAAGDAGSLMRILHAQVDSLEKDLAAGRLERAHNLPDKIVAIGRKMKGDATLMESKRERVLGYLRTMKKGADKMHEHADAGKVEAARSAFGKLKSLLALVDNQFIKAGK